MGALRNVVRSLTPPLVSSTLRFVLPKKPMFVGSYSKVDGIRNDSPWESSERFKYLYECLEDIQKLNRSGELKTEDLCKLPPTPSLIALLLNQLSLKQKIRVLDFGGGTGIIYFLIRRFLFRSENIDWRVVDSKNVIAIGEKLKHRDDQIEFYSELNADAKPDFILINTTLQYVWDYKSVLAKLCLLNSKHIFLTRLLAGPITPFFTQQTNVHGGLTPALFLNEQDITNQIEEAGLKRIFRINAEEDYFSPVAYRDIPLEQQISCSINLLFSRDF